MNIIGRVTRDAEVRSLSEDKKVVNFSIAVNDSYKPKNGEKVTHTEFFDCSYWLATGIAQYLTKGSIVELTGRLSSRAYLDSEGNPKAGLNFHTAAITLHGGNIGEPLDIIKAYHYEGVDPQTGIYRFKDYNGDGLITSDADRQAVVRRSPVYFAGLQNSLRYQNWSLDFLFQYVKQTGTRGAYLGMLPGTVSNQPAEEGVVWSQPGDQASVQQYTTGFNNEATTAFYRYIGSDGVFTDASYLRLKNLSISYTLPDSFAGRVKCRLYVQGQNLLTITGYKGADPETQFSGYLPPLRIMSMGVQLTF